MRSIKRKSGMHPTALKNTLFAGLLFIGIVGCGGGDGFDRVPFAGTVSVEGNSTPSGSIVGTANLNSTATADPNELPTVHASILDGKFEFLSGEQPVAGPYQFEIYITVPDEKSENEGESAPGDEEETGGNSVTYTKSVTVPEGGSEDFKIELTNSDKRTPGAMPASGER